MHAGNDIALKQAQDEIQRLRAMNKDREGILTEIDTKNQSLRETETQFKLTQNDLEIMQNKYKNMEQQCKEYVDKNEELERKVQTHKDN